MKYRHVSIPEKGNRSWKDDNSAMLVNGSVSTKRTHLESEVDLLETNQEEITRRKLPGLLVEDNRADILLVEEAIDTYGIPIELHIVEDGEKAIQFIERAEQDPAAPCPKIILLDLNLPKRSGLDVLQRIRQTDKCKHVPVLIVTSSDSPQDRAQTARLGATQYFRKPADYDDFLRIGKVLEDLVSAILKDVEQ